MWQCMSPVYVSKRHHYFMDLAVLGPWIEGNHGGSSAKGMNNKRERGLTFSNSVAWQTKNESALVAQDYRPRFLSMQFNLSVASSHTPT